MEKSLATRLELLKQGVKPELMLESKGASDKTRTLAPKSISAPSKRDLESYEVFKLFENRQSVPEDAH